ncbi:MAG: type II secretion system F family protein [Mycobacterium sp.]
MSIAAVLLALAALFATGPVSAHGRAIGVPARVLRSRGESRCGTDPLASASALDILAVCLKSGMSVPAATAAASATAPLPLGAVLRRAADLTALGGDPGAAWSVHGGADGGEDATCVALMRLARRSATSGSALAQGISDLAEQVRHEVAQAANAAAGRASVLIAGPLGLCFLPAFVCVGVVPVVIGLASDVFSSGPL